MMALGRYGVASWMRPIVSGCLVLLASFVFASASSDTALAACDVKIGSGAVYHATFYQNECVDAGRGFPARGSSANVDAISLGYVIPRTAVNTNLDSEALAGVNNKTDLYERLRYHYNDRGWSQKDWWAKDGAAFVVYSMIGKNPPDDRNLTDADWDEFRERLNNPALTMELDNDYPLSPNSASVYATPSGRQDFAYFDDTYGFKGPSFVFKLNGVLVGSIERKCANMLGNFDLPPASQWTTAGRTLVGVGPTQTPNVQTWDVKPGETVRWNHRLWNNSSYGMSKDVYWSVRQSGFTYSGSLWRNTNANPQGWNRGGPGNVNSPFVNEGPAAFDTEYVVRHEEVGNELCQWLVWTPNAWDKVIDTPAGTSTSTKACVTVPYDFNLIPKIAPITSAAEPGVTVGPITPTVTNAGPTWSFPGTNWQLSRFVVSPTGTKPSGADNDRNPCIHYANGCTPVTSGSDRFVLGDTVIGQVPSITVDDLALGSQLCYALSVSAFDEDHISWWRHSEPQCIKIGKKPKLQIWGDDLAVRGNISTSTTRKNGTMFGSWVEYGALSVGTNAQLASGAGLSNQTSDLQKDWSKLTFANSDTPGGGFGKYTTSSSVFRSQPLIAQYFSTGKATAAYDKSSDLNGNSFATGDSVVVRTTDTLDLAAGTLPKGRSLIIVATGTVTIKGNLDYANGAMTSVRDIPQLVIIASKIDIEADVTNVDAWLVTSNAVTGEIDTCSTVDGDLSGADCNKSLVVHGPVLAGKLFLKRTAGSGTGDQSGDPAETFNLRPDVHLWAQLVASGNGRAETVDVVELPPRF